MDKSKFKLKKEWRKFGIVLAVILLAISVYQFYKGNSNYIYFLGSSLFLILVSIFIPILIKPIFILFSYIGFLIGWLMTRVILFILFYAILTPISIIARLFGNRFLDLDFKQNIDSYWLTINHQKNDRENFEKQF